MYSVFITSFLLSCITIEAVKVINWPADESEPNEVKNGLEVPEAPYEVNANGDFEFKESAALKLSDENIDINQGRTPKEKDLKNTQNLENRATQNTQEKSVSKAKKTYPTCLTDFIGTIIYDLMQNENGRIVVSTFLNAFTHTTSNGISSNMYLHISRQLKNLFKDSEGSRSISIISDTFTKLLTDERAAQNLNVVTENFKTKFTRPETTLLVENINELLSSLSTHPRSRRIFRAFADGILPLLEKSDPKNAIISGFQDLRSYTWPRTIASQNLVVNN